MALPDERELEYELREIGLTKSEARRLLSGGYRLAAGQPPAEMERTAHGGLWARLKAQFFSRGWRV
jgi:hypothetical protein